MTKILMCGSSRREKGGINSVIDQLMNHKWDNTFEISYLATHVSGNSIKKALFFFVAYIKLYFLIANNCFDIIHIHMSYKGSFYRKYLITKLCKKYNKKVIIHLHGSEFKEFYNNANTKLKNKIENLFEIADCTIALGDDWKKFILNISPNANVIVINNAVKIPENIVKEKNEKTTFLFLGALIERKGIMDLLIASKEIAKTETKNFKVMIAGSGEEEEKLKSFCRENKLTEIVEFLGWVDNSQKKDLFKKCDILVLPSYNEGLPIAILEAISYGLPVISTDVGSINEAVINMKNGFLYEPGDKEVLKKDMKLLIEDNKLWNEFSTTSRNIAKDKFSDEKFFEKIKELYNQIN